MREGVFMNFTKMNGLGNDFIIVEGESTLPENAAQLAVKLCDRFFGIGADGLVYILPSSKADAMMRIMNPDGSEAEQCGNAIRCVAKYLYDHKLVKQTELTIETLGAGAQQVQLTLHLGVVEAVRVDMGVPILHGLEVPTTINMETVVNHPIDVEGSSFNITAVSMGNPHCVVYVDDAIDFDLMKWGPKFETHPLFPKKINAEFVTVNSRTHLDMRVWERGAGPTLACGTGACATAVASVLNGKTDRKVTVSLKGGDLLIDWDESNNHVYMTGPAEEVYKGILVPNFKMD